MKWNKLLFSMSSILFVVFASNLSHANNKVAVVVGIEQYDQVTSGVTPLDFTVDDASQLSTVLNNNGYVVKTLLDSQASKHIILGQIKEAAKLVDRENGTLVFSFSGHGFSENNINYLVVSGTTTSNLKDSALSLDDVLRTIRSTGIKRAALFIDACRNVPGVKSLAKGFVPIAGQGIQLLVSTKAGEYSYETPALGNGVFSHFLIKGLKGEAKRPDGIIEFTDLAHYVETNVREWSFKNLNQVQQPYHFASGELFGQFLLAGVQNTNTTAVPSGNLGKCHQNNNFHKAAAGGDAGFVQNCLNLGFPVDKQESNGWTPLHSAARNGRNAIVTILLRSGANVNAVDSTGRTPADQANFSKKTATMNLLLNNGGVKLR